MGMAIIVPVSAIDLRTGIVRPIVTLWRHARRFWRFHLLWTIDDCRRIPLHRHGLHEIRNADCHLTIESRWGRCHRLGYFPPRGEYATVRLPSCLSLLGICDSLPVHWHFAARQHMLDALFRITLCGTARSTGCCIRLDTMRA